MFREELRQAERKAQQAEFEKETLVKRIAELERQIQTAESQVRIVSGNLDQGQLELQELDDKIAQENLQMLLETRMTQENALVELRQNLDDLAQQLRVMLEGRLQLERGLQPQRDKIVSLQLKEQAARINVEQYDQKLAEVMADVRELTQWISPHAKVSAFQAEISRLSTEIDGLGPVNLGAAMELDEGEISSGTVSGSDRCHCDAGRRHQTDRPGNADAAEKYIRSGQQFVKRAVSGIVRWGPCPAFDDRQRDSGCRGTDHGTTAR